MGRKLTLGSGFSWRLAIFPLMILSTEGYLNMQHYLFFYSDAGSLKLSLLKEKGEVKWELCKRDEMWTFPKKMHKVKIICGSGPIKGVF